MEHDRSSVVVDHRSVVVVDETGMARTDDLAALLTLLEDCGAKAVLAGDAHQLGAVGPGGIFRTVAGDHGAHELETVRRFHHAWEAAASLRLRDGTASILDVYARHGRIAGGSRAEMVEAAFDAWRAARERGESLLLMAGDNATADELSRRCRAELVRRGTVEAHGVQVATGTIGHGDTIVTGRNDRRIRTSNGDFVRNGARWRVAATTDSGTVVVESLDGAGTTRLPAAYVRAHVALGYAVTIHKAQGHTTDRAAVLVDERTSVAQLYVGMSRGREDNRAFVICADDDPDAHERRPPRDPLEVLRSVISRDDANRSAHDVMRRNHTEAETIDPPAPERATPPKPESARRPGGSAPVWPLSDAERSAAVRAFERALVARARRQRRTRACRRRGGRRRRRGASGGSARSGRAATAVEGV